MGKGIVFTQPRAVEIQPFENLPLGEHQVRVRTWYSGISAGTEMAAYRGSSPFVNKRWDLPSRLFVEAETPSLPYPQTGFGYEEVGEVIEIGTQVTRLQVGDVVYGTWGHRTQHVLDEDFAAQRIKPAGLDPLLAIYSHIGPIALNGILDANIHIGENVAVFGMGVLGQVIAQLAKRSGARVIAIDPIESRLELGCTLGGVDEAINPRRQSPGERIKELTGGRGADVCIEISGFTGALHEAIRSAAYNARVVALGFFQGEASGLFLGEEFHHNRIQIVCSQIGNQDPALHHRWDRLRLIHTIMDLQAQGALNLRPVITHVIPFEQAAAGYRLLDETPEQALQVVLDFRNATE